MTSAALNPRRRISGCHSSSYAGRRPTTNRALFSEPSSINTVPLRAKTFCPKESLQAKCLQAALLDASSSPLQLLTWDEAMHPRSSGPSASFIGNACRVTTRLLPGHKLHFYNGQVLGFVWMGRGDVQLQLTS